MSMINEFDINLNLKEIVEWWDARGVKVKGISPKKAEEALAGLGTTVIPGAAFMHLAGIAWPLDTKITQTETEFKIEYPFSYLLVTHTGFLTLEESIQEHLWRIAPKRFDRFKGTIERISIGARCIVATLTLPE